MSARKTEEAIAAALSPEWEPRSTYNGLVVHEPGAARFWELRLREVKAGTEERPDWREIATELAMAARHASVDGPACDMCKQALRRYEEARES